MPRRVTASRSLKQNTLDDFVRSSSPAQPQTPTTPKRKVTSRNRGMQRKRGHSSPSRASHIPTKDDTSESSDVGEIHFESEAIFSEDDDKEASPRRPSTKKRRTRPMRADSEEANSAPSSHEDGNVGIAVAWKSRSTKGKRKQVIIVEDSDQEEPPQMRKLVRGVRPPSPEEEDVDLLDEIDEDKIIEPRLRTRNKKSTFQRNLEKLKQKKLGKAALSDSSGSEEEDEPIPFHHARPSNKGISTPSDDEAMDAAEEDEDTFIVEDDNTEAPELPVAFSMTTHQDLVHQFKIICQLFVHLAVHGKDNRASVLEELLEKEYFSVPLEVTRRKIIGMRDSLVTSSVWRPEFKKPLETYPEFETIRLDFAIPTCHACHLGGRMSTLLGRLSGTPYDKFGFESVNESDSDEGTSDEEDDAPRARKEFHLGRFCAARTRVFHKFTHWEYSLFRSLLQEVNELRDNGGGGRFVRVAFAGGIQPPEDLSDADAIMDWLDQRGVINMEWVKIKEMMESARNLEMRVKKGEDEDD